MLPEKQIARLVEAIKQLKDAGINIIVAVDGGADGPSQLPRERAASWAVTIAKSPPGKDFNSKTMKPSAFLSECGIIGGMDVSSRAAEHAALNICLTALDRANADATI